MESEPVEATNCHTIYKKLINFNKIRKKDIMPNANNKTKKIDLDSIKNTIDNFFKELDDKNIGAIVLPYPKNKDDIPNRNIFGCGDFKTNIKNQMVVRMALTAGLKSFTEKEEFDGPDSLTPKGQVMDLAMQLTTASSMIDDGGVSDGEWQKVLSVRTADIVKMHDRDVLMLIAPSNINEKLKEGNGSMQMDGAVLATCKPDDFAHFITLIINSYCKKNNLGIEETMDNIFKSVMTGSIDTREKED